MSFTEKHLACLHLPFPVCKTSDNCTYSCHEDVLLNSFGLQKRCAVERFVFLYYVACLLLLEKHQETDGNNVYSQHGCKEETPWGRLKLIALVFLQDIHHQLLLG